MATLNAIGNKLQAVVCGIPATIELHNFDIDGNNLVDVQYTVCDRRGRAAPWLERKMTMMDRSRVMELIARLCE